MVILLINQLKNLLKIKENIDKGKIAPFLSGPQKFINIQEKK